MQQIINPTIRLMTPEEVRTTQLINAGSVLMFGSTAIPIGAGRGDRIHVFKVSTVLYILSTNSNLGYMGLEIFDSSTGEEFEQIFLQYQWKLDKYLGSDWQDMEPIAIIRKLVAYLFQPNGTVKFLSTKAVDNFVEIVDKLKKCNVIINGFSYCLTNNHACKYLLLYVNS